MAEKHTLRAAGGSDQLRLTGTASIDIQAAPADGGKAKKTIRINAYNGGAIRPSWTYSDYAVVTDLAGMSAAEPVAILLDHEHDQIVGQSTAVNIVSGSGAKIDLEAIITGDVENPDDPAGKVALHARNGFVWKASIGCEVRKYEKIEAGTVVTVNGREFAGPLYVIRQSVLNEVSLLSIGADKTASAKVAASAAKETNMDFHEWLKAKGFDPANLDDKQRDTLLKAFQGEQEELKAKAAASKAPGAPGAEDSSIDEALRPLRARQARQSRVVEVVRKFASQNPDRIDDIEAAGRRAIAEDITPETLELELYREMRPRIQTGIRASSGTAVTDDRVFEAALCQAGKLDGIENHFDERTLEAASRQWRHGIGLGELLVMAARANGVDVINTKNVDRLLKGAFGAPDRMRASGTSTMDVSGILSNVANKFIMQYFMSVDNAWRAIARRRPVNDFKAITSYSLTGDFTFKKLAPGGKLEHGKLGELSYTNQADTRGRMFAIDRRDIVNDDLGAFMEVQRRIGRGGALSLNEAFWTEFLDNSTFFTTAHGNLDEGADTALSVESLELAETLFATQTDADGKPIAVVPRILLVPSSLKRTALRCMNSTEVRELQSTTSGTGSAKTYGTGNTFAGDFQVVSSPYMQASAYTGNSTKKWYLLADPNDIPVIEVCFLNGVENPTVEQAMADFGQLGIQMLGYFDFGCKLQEYRGGVAMKGEN